MVPRLVPEISSLDAFCDGGAAAGIGDSRSLIMDAKKARVQRYAGIQSGKYIGHMLDTYSRQREVVLRLDIFGVGAYFHSESVHHLLKDILRF